MGVMLNDTYVQLAFGSLIIMLVSYVLLRRVKYLKLKEPPLVPYKYPIIGHTIDFYKDNKNFIKKCHAEYGEIFSLFVFGKIITFVGKELSCEILKNHKDFSFIEASRENFPFENFLNRPNEFTDTLPRMVQINLSGQIKLYTERVQRQLIKSIDEMIGNGKVLEPPLKFFQFIIAKPIAATMVGEELSDDKELVNSFANVTTDFIPFLSIPPVLNFIHPYLHQQVMIFVFKYLNNPFKMHRELIKKKITPVIEKRLREMKESGDNYVSPIDILQRYTELLHKDYTVDIDVVTDNMIISIFASVYNTSNSLTFCLTWYKLVNNPQFLKEILEEQEQLYKSNEKSYYSTEQIARMEKLDSFIKETLRVNVNNVALQHKTLSSYFTFSNGYQVPKGRLVNICSGEIHSDKELQGQNADEFNAFRYLKKNSPATRADKSFLTFGLGKHTCPGRHFAVNEIKLTLHYLLLKYDIKKSSIEKIKPKIYGALKFPSDEGLIFEKRELK
ncbi:cytochrome P450 [Rhizophagus irregularis]|uniref:Cytochrome P450 n=1 Tax=Rhizophagus irregularis TaxID=588596 RepID=A0A2I1HAX4_9GLOM|nr:cytochrome P450 [Rhizophagus irregularis]